MIFNWLKSLLEGNCFIDGFCDIGIFFFIILFIGLILGVLNDFFFFRFKEMIFEFFIFIYFGGVLMLVIFCWDGGF